MATDSSTQDSRRYVHLGKYPIIAHIASGGMATVYRGLDPDTGREVALKVLPADSVAGKPALLERFRREAQHGAKLRHENIVALYEFGEAGGTYFLVMEFVDGINLAQRIEKEGPLEPEEARLVLVQMARALDHAHQHGIVHRDIKPANILLTQKDGRTIAKLADLGLARTVQEEEFRVTRDGCTVGTVDYMAPEQARNSASADIRSDLYSLGCTVFHLLAGVPPFNKGTLPERMYQHLKAPPPDVRDFNPLVPPDLLGALRRLLAKKPDDRYQTPRELLDELAPKPLPRPQPNAGRRGTRATLSRETPTEVEAPAPKVPAGEGAGPAMAAGPVLSGSTGTGDVRVAAGQYEWAKEQLLRGNRAYGIDLLVACCKLDPANLEYHQALRVAVKGYRGRGGWTGWLRGLGTWLKFKLARRRRDPLDVLAWGAALLARNPANLRTQLAMAAAAEELHLGELTFWLLEQARQQDGKSPAVNRALGRYHESREDYDLAVACWERVVKADATDLDAAAKLRNLAAMHALQRARDRQAVPKGDVPDARR
jgi:hypothetical protein